MQLNDENAITLTTGVKKKRMGKARGRPPTTAHCNAVNFSVLWHHVLTAPRQNVMTPIPRGANPFKRIWSKKVRHGKSGRRILASNSTRTSSNVFANQSGSLTCVTRRENKQLMMSPNE
eukprot:2998318-Prymnesium_polylepis.4